jgi:hypothetical protein
MLLSNGGVLQMAPNEILCSPVVLVVIEERESFPSLIVD